MFGLSCFTFTLHPKVFVSSKLHFVGRIQYKTVVSDFSAEFRRSFQKNDVPWWLEKTTAPLRGTPQSRTTYIFNIKVPDGPVFQRYVRNCCHIDIFKVLGAGIPVLLTFDLKQTHGVTDELFCSRSGCCVRVAAHSSLFIAACQHDQSLHVLLPDHSPEIFDRGGQRTLSCNELLPGVVTLPYKTTQTSVFPRRVSDIDVENGVNVFWTSLMESNRTSPSNIYWWWRNDQARQQLWGASVRTGM